MEKINKVKCMSWIATPTINPLTKRRIELNKDTFNKLVRACRTHLSPEDIASINGSMMKYIYPQEQRHVVPSGPQGPSRPTVPSGPSGPSGQPQERKAGIGRKGDQERDQERDQEGDQKGTIEMPPGLGLGSIPPPPPPRSPPRSPPPPAKKILHTTRKKEPSAPEKKVETKVETKVEHKVTVGKGVRVGFKIESIDTKKHAGSTDKDDKDDEDDEMFTRDQLVKMIADDKFIDDLLKAEQMFINSKLSIYKDILKETHKLMEDPMVKSEQPELSKTLEAKLKSIKTNMDSLELRAKNIHSEGKTQIPVKRGRILDILTDPVNGIDTLKGEARESIRRQLYTQIVTFARAPKIYLKQMLNYAVMGGAGTGKTKLAGVLGNFFNNLGMINTNKVVVVTRGDLVGQNVGETAPKTRGYLASTLEGLLFIDEAYQLAGTGISNDFGPEAVAEMVNYIDKHVGLSIVIVAGYEDKMNANFFASNEGLNRRFPNKMILDDYTSKDLSTILHGNIQSLFAGPVLTENQIKYIDMLVKIINESEPNKHIKDRKYFINQAGDMLNLSNIIVQDLILADQKGYTDKYINDSFTKFFLSKGIQLVFE